MACEVLHISFLYWMPLLCDLEALELSLGLILTSVTLEHHNRHESV